jgi:hypothetical protein
MIYINLNKTEVTKKENFYKKEDEPEETEGKSELFDYLNKMHMFQHFVQ